MQQSVDENFPSTCNVHGQFVTGEEFDYVIEDHPELGMALEGGWCVGHPVGNKFVTWKPGKPFPSSLEYSVINKDELKK